MSTRNPFKISSCAVFLWLAFGCGTNPEVEATPSDPHDTVTAESSDSFPSDSQTLENETADIADSASDTGTGGEIESDAPVETAAPSCEDGDQAQCVAVDPGYPEGTATCGTDSQWDLSECWYGEEATEIGGWISPAPQVKIGYILNGARMEDQMYILQHQTHVLPRAVFKGEHLGKIFPPAGVNLTYGWRVDMGGEPGILVLQMTNQGITPQSPMVQMIFLTDDLQPGSYLMGQQVVASLINVDPKTQSQCVVGVAYGGSVEVTESKNTTKLEGGSFSFVFPHEIHLYHPSDTTFGDLSGTFEGIEACL